MNHSSFWYQHSTVSPRGAREGPGGAQHPLPPPLRSAYVSIYYLDTNPVMLTRSTTTWSLSEYFFGARVAVTDSNDPPRRKIVRVSGVRVAQIRPRIRLAEALILHH